MPFASASYVSANDVPKSIADFRGHRLVSQTDDRVGEALIGSLLDDEKRSERVTFETNTSAAHYWAIANGAGIGFMPSYTALLDPALVPIDVGTPPRRDVFLVRHADRDGNAQIAAARDWIAAAFDETRFPCFGTAFVHPAQFPKADGAPLFGEQAPR